MQMGKRPLCLTSALIDNNDAIHDGAITGGDDTVHSGFGNDEVHAERVMTLLLPVGVMIEYLVTQVMIFYQAMIPSAVAQVTTP